MPSARPIKDVPALLFDSLDQSSFKYPVPNLGTICESQLVEDVGDVRLNSAFAEDQCFGNLAVRFSLGDMYGDFAFPLGQPSKLFFRRLAR